MSKEYIFELAVTKEDFINILNRFHHNTSYSSEEFITITKMKIIGIRSRT